MPRAATELELESRRHRNKAPNVVLELLAIGSYDAAIEQLELALRRRAELHLGVDPFITSFIRDNNWTDPVLEQPRFVQLRARLGQDDP